MHNYLKVFTNKRMLVTLLLGFSSGIPLMLTGSTLQAWLSNAKVDITTIGQFSLVGLPYAMKFLWAPLLDAKTPPFLGLRRGWMVICQIALFIATVGLGQTDPVNNITMFSIMALFVAFFSASQDIVVDAYRTEMITDEKELGAAASTYISGYRLGTIISGGVGLVMSDHMSWSVVFFWMAVINLVGLVTILCSEEPKTTRKARSINFRESVTKPFLEFFQRGGAMEILIFIMVYKISTLMATALTTKFLIDLGYTNTAIGTVTKGIGIVATIGGVLVGGSLMSKFGLKRSLWIFGVIQSLVGLTYCALAHWGSGESETYKHVWLVSIICLDNFMMGLGTTALVSFMMNFCSKVYTATQYALLSSVIAVSRVILIAHAGTLVALLGYDWFFILTVPMAIPGLLLLSRFDHWESVSKSTAQSRISMSDSILIGVFVISLICLSSDPLWQALKMKDVSGRVALTGAIGVIIVVLAGLIRPYFTPRRSLPR